jgi:hypothetical protein
VTILRFRALARLVADRTPTLSERWRREQLRRETTTGVEGPAWDWAAIKQAATLRDDDHDDHDDPDDPGHRKEEQQP